jgi:protein SCO1/2
MMVRFWFGLMLAGLLLGSSCKRAPERAALPTRNTHSTNQQVFQVKGVVKAVRPAQKEVEIKHEAIPGYMPGMTMPFDVRDTNELAGLEPGEPISFRLTVTDTEGWIDQIHTLGSVTNEPPAPAGVQRVRDVEPSVVGDVLPEYHFTNQFAQSVSTSQFKGQALAITFLFTRCPFPTFCPRMANQFEEAQQKLLTVANAPTNWHLLAISFDPEFDTPAVLKAYAETHHYDSRYWTFATGDLTDITAIGEQFGLAFWHDQTGSITHNLRTAVIDTNGRLQKVFEGGNWTSAELAAELVKAAGKGDELLKR